MVRRYYEVNHIKAEFMGDPKAALKPTTPLKYVQENIGVMLSGGKDSVHLLLKLLEKYPKEKIHCLYTSNLNRSETYYEKIAIKNICEHLGVSYTIITPINSIKLNRTGHNIALREEIATVLSIPTLIDKKIKHVYFGSFNSFAKIDPIMYCSSKECLEFLNQWTTPFGFTLEFHNHVDFNSGSHIGVFEEMATKYREILLMTSSCYTQLNFREHRYELFKKHVPAIPIYQGCGSCIKCLRINSAILLFDEKARRAPEREKLFLFNHLEAFWRDRYAADTSLGEHMKLLIPQYSGKCKSSHSLESHPSVT